MGYRSRNYDRDFEQMFHVEPSRTILRVVLIVLVAAAVLLTINARLDDDRVFHQGPVTTVSR